MKKQKLLEEFVSFSGPVVVPGGTSSSSTLANKVAGTHSSSMLVHSTLNQLFGKKNPQSSLKKDKPITVTLIPNDMVMPKSKHKQLRQEKIEMLYISTDDTSMSLKK